MGGKQNDFALRNPLSLLSLVEKHDNFLVLLLDKEDHIALQLYYQAENYCELISRLVLKRVIVNTLVH